MKALALISIILFSVSGNNVFLVSICYIFSAIFGILFLIENRVFFTRNTLFASVLFVTYLVSSFLLLPVENVVRFLMAVYAFFGVSIIFRYLLNLPLNEIQNVFHKVILFYLLGSIIQASGVLGHQMELYKSLFEIPYIVNSQREVDLGIFETRLSGFFSEPSYFAVHYSIACAALFLCGNFRSAVLYFCIGFLVCPSPIFLFAGAIVILSGQFSFKVRLKHIVMACLLLAFLLYFQASRFYAFWNDLNFVLDGGHRLTSFTHRLMLPVIEFLKFLFSNDIPLPYGCIESQSCSPYLLKIPFITFWVFSSLHGLAAYIFMMKILTMKSFSRISVCLIVGSIFSGGSAFMPHFAFIIGSMLLLSGSPKFKRDLMVVYDKS